MERQIVCFQIPAFEIALARLQDTSIRSRPVAIAPAHTLHACLHDVSHEAHRDGLRTGMPVDLARRLCPSLRLLPPDPGRVRLAHERLQHAVARIAPVWESVRPGHLFLDLTGTSRLLGPAVDVATRLEHDITTAQGLSGVVGVASNKLVSGVAAATLREPPELRDVRPGWEQPFLAPLPVSLLPGLSGTQAKKILAGLDDLNLHTMGEIAGIPLSHLTAALGRPAERLYRWVHGIDASPVLPLMQRPRLELSVNVEPDEIDTGRLLALLHGFLETLCHKLRAQHRVCRRLSLTVRHSDHLDVSHSHTLHLGTYWEVDMFPALKALFLRCVRRRVRLRTLTLVAEMLEPAEEQLSLFDDTCQASSQRMQRHRLARALDRVRDRFGDQSLWWGRSRLSP